MDKWLSITAQLTAQVAAKAENQFSKVAQLGKQTFGGQAENQTELPEDIIPLQKRIKALENANSRMIKVTNNFTKETYDYPTDLRETFTDMSRNVLDGIHTISQATSSDQVTAVLRGNNPNSTTQHKTFSHALSRASLASSHAINNSHTEEYHGPNTVDHLSDALYEYSTSCEVVGTARLKQDLDIQTTALAGWREMDQIHISNATEAVARLEATRSELDTAKGQGKGGIFNLKKGNDSGENDENDLHDDFVSKERQAKVDELVDIYEAEGRDAVDTMNSVLAMQDPLESLIALAKAQQEYHQTAADEFARLLIVLGEKLNDQPHAENTN